MHGRSTQYSMSFKNSLFLLKRISEEIYISAVAHCGYYSCAVKCNKCCKHIRSSPFVSISCLYLSAEKCNNCYADRYTCCDSDTCKHPAYLLFLNLVFYYHFNVLYIPSPMNTTPGAAHSAKARLLQTFCFTPSNALIILGSDLEYRHDHKSDRNYSADDHKCCHFVFAPFGLVFLCICLVLLFSFL